MGQAYTPGLKVVNEELVKVERRLPLKGDVVVTKGQKVRSEEVVAKTDLPGRVEIINVVNKLAISPADVPDAMKVREGDKVKKGDLIAEVKMFFIFPSRVFAPADGSVESVSPVTGQVVFRHPPVPVEIPAYIDGEVDEIIPDEGVIIKSVSCFIQGIFGIGGEVVGELLILSSKKGDLLDESAITEKVKDKIIVVGSFISAGLIEKAKKFGCRGIIGGGIDAEDLKNFLGYDLGVAITGAEKKGITLIITEGFGKVAIADRTYNLLVQNQGRKTSINGATQIRAGVIRPEIIIPLGKSEVSADAISKVGGMEKGGYVRLIREPGFGELVEVVDLPIKPVVIDTEAKVRSVTVRFSDGKELTIPRANVELVEK
ncbi:hypothetical protein KAJ27_12250 [bacterium]|nr:hypothetical protein [bacterium]